MAVFDGFKHWKIYKYKYIIDRFCYYNFVSVMIIINFYRITYTYSIYEYNMNI